MSTARGEGTRLIIGSSAPPIAWSVPKDRHRRELVMSLPRTVAEIPREHVTLDVEGIDGMYLNAYVPGLQYERGVAAFFRRHRGQPFASSALMDPISKAFVAAIHALVHEHGV